MIVVSSGSSSITVPACRILQLISLCGETSCFIMEATGRSSSKRALHMLACSVKTKQLQFQLRSRVACILHQHGWVTALPSPVSVIEPAQHVFGCVHCQSVHATRARESAHMFKRHGFRASARQLFDGTSCPHCLREYHTRAKVLAHLRHSQLCQQSLIGRKLHCDPAPGTEHSMRPQMGPFLTCMARDLCYVQGSEKTLCLTTFRYWRHSTYAWLI